MYRGFTTGLIAATLLAGPIAAQAAVVVYSNEGAFAAASGATLHALPSGINADSLTTVDGALTFSTAGISGNNMITDWAAYPGVGVSRLTGVEMAISGTESFNSSVTLGTDRYAFGFGIYESTDSSLPGCNCPLHRLDLHDHAEEQRGHGRILHLVAGR